jgi:hypothetical protein
MEVADVLRSGFLLANQRLQVLALDLLWKFLHLASTAVLISGVSIWLMQDLSQLQWQGPELTPSNPILLVMALAVLWSNYSGSLAWAAVSILMGTTGLWIVLEALFRGGRRFWIYACTRCAGLIIMVPATVLLVALTIHGGLQTAIVSAFVLLGMWWIVTISETLVRRDAVDLLATNLPVVSGALGSLLGLQLFLSAASVAIAGLCIKLLLRESSPSQFLAAAFLMLTALIFWTIMHSYLVVVRYSTIDIMRGNVVDV